jgi:hypothetical protein
MATATPPPAYYQQLPIMTFRAKSDAVWENYDTLSISNVGLKVVGKISENLVPLYTNIWLELKSLGIESARIEELDESSISITFRHEEFTFYLESFTYNFENGVNTIFSWYQNDIKLPTVSGSKETVMHELKRLFSFSFA